jgi:hypothetical protein
MKKIGIRFIFIGLVVFFSVGVFFKVKAQQTGFNLTISPVKQEVTLQPGETKTIPLILLNRTSGPIFGTVKAVDFIVKGNTNEPILLENVQISSRYSAAKWISLPYTDITLPSQDRVVVYAQITAPVDALIGGHYAAILMETNPALGSEKGEAASAIVHRVVSLVNVTIPGDVKEIAGISKFFAKRFSEYGPISVDTNIVNNGYIHIQPKGTIELKNIFGAVLQKIPLEAKNIFPDAITVYKNELGQKWMLGRYQLILNAVYGKNNQTLASSLYVWVIPWKVLIVIIILLLIAIIFGKKTYENSMAKEIHLEKEVAKEKEEIKKLKDELRKKE